MFDEFIYPFSQTSAQHAEMDLDILQAPLVLLMTRTHYMTTCVSPALVPSMVSPRASDGLVILPLLVYNMLPPSARGLAPMSPMTASSEQAIAPPFGASVDPIPTFSPSASPARPALIESSAPSPQLAGTTAHLAHGSHAMHTHVKDDIMLDIEHLNLSAIHTNSFSLIPRSY
jgi:hypothetical protein